MPASHFLVLVCPFEMLSAVQLCGVANSKEFELFVSIALRCVKLYLFLSFFKRRLSSTKLHSWSMSELSCFGRKLFGPRVQVCLDLILFVTALFSSSLAALPSEPTDRSCPCCFSISICLFVIILSVSPLPLPLASPSGLYLK